jgi:hypothetical protein
MAVDILFAKTYYFKINFKKMVLNCQPVLSPRSVKRRLPDRTFP